MKRLAVLVILPAGCLLAMAGAMPDGRRTERYPIHHPKFGLLVLVFVVAAISSIFNVEAARERSPDIVDSIELLSTSTEIVPFGPRIFGLHTHFAVLLDIRTFHASIRVRSLSASGAFRPNLIEGSTRYPVYRHNGQPLGTDRWFAAATIPVKPTVILLC